MAYMYVYMILKLNDDIYLSIICNDDDNVTEIKKNVYN